MFVVRGRKQLRFRGGHPPPLAAATGEEGTADLMVIGSMVKIGVGISLIIVDSGYIVDDSGMG